MMSGGMNSDYFGHFAPFFLCLQVIENILKLFAGSGWVYWTDLSGKKIVEGGKFTRNGRQRDKEI